MKQLVNGCWVHLGMDGSVSESSRFLKIDPCRITLYPSSCETGSRTFTSLQGGSIMPGIQTWIVYLHCK